MDTTNTPTPAPTFTFCNCPVCGWCGLQVTKAGKVRKHGRAQTGKDGGCEGSGTIVTAANGY